VASGGAVVVDDLTPLEPWPDEWTGWRDPVRNFWLHHTDFVATEVRTTATTTALIATKR
jgi:hypothetical protein